MTDTHPTPEQLDRLITALRDDIAAAGLTQPEVARLARISPKTVVLLLDRSRPRLRISDSHRALAAALRWAPGSIERVMDGGLPAYRDPAPDPGLTCEQKLAAITDVLGELSLSAKAKVRGVEEVMARPLVPCGA